QGGIEDGPAGTATHVGHEADAAGVALVAVPVVQEVVRHLASECLAGGGRHDPVVDNDVQGHENGAAWGRAPLLFGVRAYGGGSGASTPSLTGGFSCPRRPRLAGWTVTAGPPARPPPPPPGQGPTPPDPPRGPPAGAGCRPGSRRPAPAGRARARGAWP